MLSEKQWFEATLAFAHDLAAQRLHDIELDLQAHPDEHARFTKAIQELDTVESKLTAESDPRLLRQMDVWMEYSGALALEAYLYGVRDGGRICHVFVTGELPMTKEAHHDEHV